MTDMNTAQLDELILEDARVTWAVTHSTVMKKWKWMFFEMKSPAAVMSTSRETPCVFHGIYGRHTHTHTHPSRCHDTPERVAWITLNLLCF